MTFLSRTINPQKKSRSIRSVFCPQRPTLSFGDGFCQRKTDSDTVRRSVPSPPKPLKQMWYLLCRKKRPGILYTKLCEKRIGFAQKTNASACRRVLGCIFDQVGQRLHGPCPVSYTHLEALRRIEEKGLCAFLSLTHEGDFATAFVVLEQNGCFKKGFPNDHTD